MGNKKAAKIGASNISSAANPTASSTTQNASKSSILRSSFCPSHFQLACFASVIQGFDSQHLRIHDTATGRLRCDHAINSKASINCLDWGFHGGTRLDRHSHKSQKKRKRSELVNGDTSSASVQDVVLAFGTSDASIQLFSPTDAKIVGTLSGGHTQGIQDFKFAEQGLHAVGWSLGGDGKLVQWDIRSGTVMRIVPVPHGSASALRPLRSSVLCALHDAYLMEPGSKEEVAVFTASTNSVHTILSSTHQSLSDTSFLTSAESDRFINVFNTASSTSVGSLRTENEALSLDLLSNHERAGQAETESDLSVRLLRPQEILAVVNKDGVLEIFPEPFDFGNTSSKQGSGNLKARMKQRTRKAAAQVRIKRPDKVSAVVPLLSASFQLNDIDVAWVEGGVKILFERIPWRDADTGNLILKEVTDIVKTKSGAGIGAVVMNGVKDVGRSHVDESQAIITNGVGPEDVLMEGTQPEVIDISSAEEKSESEDDSPRIPEQNKQPRTDKLPDREDVDMEDLTRRPERDATGHDLAVDRVPVEEAEEPSFGDLIRANAPEAINVEASFVDSKAQSLVPVGETGLQQLPSGMSLGTVLTQSLRTNDTNLLETCFHVKDYPTVRATIERLDSTFASTLLQKLAERLHSRPGRAGSLMVWIQWTLVAHGGYLASQPELMKKLASLHQVVKARANSLQPLLALKGKLDMLEAQINLRKSMQTRMKMANALDKDDEEGVIYVEGQESSDSEDEEDKEAGVVRVGSTPQKIAAKPRKSKIEDIGEGKPDEENKEQESEDDMPTTANGAVSDPEDEDSESDSEGLFDQEASSTDNDSAGEASEEDDVDHDSVDSISSSSDADDASPPPKRPATVKLSNGVTPKDR